LLSITTTQIDPLRNLILERTSPVHGTGKRRLKKGKRKIFQKNRIRSNMAKICNFISSGFFQRRKKERKSVFMKMLLLGIVD